MNWLRVLLGHETSRERERKQAELSQLTVDHERTLARAERLVPDREAERLAAALRRTVRAVRGGG